MRVRKVVIQTDLAGAQLGGSAARLGAEAVVGRRADPSEVGDFLAADRIPAREAAPSLPQPVPNRPGFGVGDAFVALGLAALLYLGVRLALQPL
jgi:hypothetical protein